MSTFIRQASLCAIFACMAFQREHTGAAENAGDLDELDGDLGGIHDGFWPVSCCRAVMPCSENVHCLSLIATKVLAMTVSWWRYVGDASDFGDGEGVSKIDVR
jgi:hypothetical protein